MLNSIDDVSRADFLNASERSTIPISLRRLRNSPICPRKFAQRFCATGSKSCGPERGPNGTARAEHELFPP